MGYGHVNGVSPHHRRNLRSSRLRLPISSQLQEFISDGKRGWHCDSPQIAISPIEIICTPGHITLLHDFNVSMLTARIVNGTSFELRDANAPRARYKSPLERLRRVLAGTAFLRPSPVLSPTSTQTSSQPSLLIPSSVSNKGIFQISWR